MIVNHRQNLLSNNNIPVIPRRKNRKEVILYDKTKYKLRLLIKNFFAKLKGKQRIIYAFW